MAAAGWAAGHVGWASGTLSPLTFLPCPTCSPHPGRRVGFYGHLDGDKWVAGEEVIAEAYDVPIPGYDTKTCRC